MKKLEKCFCHTDTTNNIFSGVTLKKKKKWCLNLLWFSYELVWKDGLPKLYLWKHPMLITVEKFINFFFYCYYE